MEVPDMRFPDMELHDMGRLKTFAAFVYDFVVGDDWRVAVTSRPGWWVPTCSRDAGVSACGWFRAARHAATGEPVACCRRP
jgi:hypothetical protein